MLSKYITLYTLFILLFSSCSGQQSRKQKTDPTGGGTPVELSHAELFTITNSPQYSTVTVLNPWQQGQEYARYYLVKSDSVSTPADGIKVTIPLKTLMSNSATHLGFLELLGKLDAVTGVCSSDYIYNPVIRQRVASGEVVDLGDAFNLDIEQLLMLRPQAVMTTAYNADDENSRRMKQTGLSILYNIEWQEKTLLGRAEWIKFIAAFFDKQPLADSIFADIEQRYNTVKQSAANTQERPTILSGQDFRGSWSMPGGKSYNAQLFNDAGGDYFYKADSTSGSITTTIEEALVHFIRADVWVGVQANSLEELGHANSMYKLFEAYKNGRVFNINKRLSETGGNDYWEGAVARPDLLLSDMIKILHPELLPDYELTYMQQLSK